MDHVSLDATRFKPARQPEAVAAGFELSHSSWLVGGVVPGIERVLFWSKAARDLLRSLGWGIAAFRQFNAATMMPSPCTSGGRLVGLS
jgi:hypothetical protein